SDQSAPAVCKMTHSYLQGLYRGRRKCLPPAYHQPAGLLSPIPVRSESQFRPFPLKFQSGFAGRVRHCFDDTVVAIATAVKHHMLMTRCAGLFSNLLSNFLSRCHVGKGLLTIG